MLPTDPVNRTVPMLSERRSMLRNETSGQSRLSRSVTTRSQNLLIANKTGGGYCCGITETR